MKIGAVFSKLAARKPVEAIRFYDKAGNEVADNPARCVIYLKPGYVGDEGLTNFTAKTAHAARLFIDSAKESDAAPVEAEEVVQDFAPVVDEVVEEEVEVPAAANDNLIIVDTAWVRERTGGMMDLPDTDKVSVTPKTMACLALMKIAAAA